MRTVAIALSFALGCQTNTGPSCDAMADHVERLLATEDGAKEIRNAFATSCTRDEWSGRVRDCIRATTSMADPQNCRKLMTSTQSEAFTLALEQVDKNLRGLLPKACHDYEAMMQRLVACQAVPQDVRDDLSGKLAEHKRGWDTMEDKSALRDVCGNGINALRSAFPECFGAP